MRLRPLSALLLAGALSVSTLTVSALPGTAVAAPQVDLPEVPGLPGLPGLPGVDGTETPDEHALAALAVVETLVDPATSPAEAQQTLTQAGEADLTGALRDLALSMDALSPADRAEAAAYLARPTDRRGDGYLDYEDDTVQRVCTDDLCVHYVVGGASGNNVPAKDASGGAGGAGNGVPDYVDFALSTLQDVHDTYAGAGYRTPLPDGAKGGDARTDVYLGDVGSMSFYGYCTSDDDVPDDARAVPAYCVLDNDYRTGQFPTNLPTENLQVTAAHEYFHAVQYAYDAGEDGWLIEATATWAEDELFDSVNDNVQYLADSPLSHPRQSMDRDEDLAVYGDWIFFRHLTERHPAAVGGLPVLVRKIWERAGAAAGDRDEYSTQAVEQVLRRQHDVSLSESFARFADANLRPGRAYAEGRAQSYPNAPLWKRTTLTGSKRSVGAQQVYLDHLSSASQRFTPGAGLGGGWRLRLSLDLPSRTRGSAAVVTVVPTSGTPSTRVLRLDRAGDAATRVGFSSARTSYVEVTLVNASTRYRNCSNGGTSTWPCGGRPVDDGLRSTLTGRVVPAG
ncbi:MXAN_6640 family putative metalloprotease [Nocardioides sp. Leaf307]|uniref:MXAN_6640 family putative metalloprotease n=1 Tax=Nocardioides sp. Leaf307 TaxID=1736331 RepID=UPI000AE05D16|nr:MXAN_6640 family putative metalloprotease [Nocardioides sp. Leaf307]